MSIRRLVLDPDSTQRAFDLTAPPPGLIVSIFYVINYSMTTSTITLIRGRLARTKAMPRRNQSHAAHDARRRDILDDMAIEDEPERRVDRSYSRFMITRKDNRANFNVTRFDLFGPTRGFLRPTTSFFRHLSPCPGVNRGIRTVDIIPLLNFA
ncbi:hypothetical protein FRC12_017252 [Ceratobasidium sp. 428]|nr:hypothetical protein FRC12_017252 [Ceratobasidium sp. 428]